MSQSRKRKERHISVRSIRRRPPDLKKLASALLLLAQSEMDAQAGHEHPQTQHDQGKQKRQDSPGGDSS